MARRSDAMRAFNLAVVGLSGTEKEKGQTGIGKSCLCNRFVRTLADDYSVDHISVLSQSDFSGRVVNNDHFLYWGDVVKTSEEGVEFLFQIIEQTEFIDDATFQPFKGGKMEPYVKRCTATKLTSAEKLMYICKNQLGIEKEYEQKVIPDGKINIDGFLCLFDVSVVPGRSIDKQVEVVTTILNNIIKAKKPVVLVTSKHDDANESYVKEAEKIVCRKEYKGAIPLIETSAHENINVDTAFFILAQLIDRTKGRSKIVPFAEGFRARKEYLEYATEAYQRLVRNHVTDYRTVWSYTAKKLGQYEEFVRFVELFGMDNAQKIFKRHARKLKDEHIATQIQGFMQILAEVLQEILPDVSILRDRDWASVQLYIKDHPDFSQYFYECPDDMTWTEYDIDDMEETRIPFDVLDTSEAETVFKNHLNSLQQEQKKLENCDYSLAELSTLKVLPDTEYTLEEEEKSTTTGFEKYDHFIIEDKQRESSTPRYIGNEISPSDINVTGNYLPYSEGNSYFRNLPNEKNSSEVSENFPEINTRDANGIAVQDSLWKLEFKQLLEATGYVTPGKLLSEVRVLFMGRECFEALTEHECQMIYDQHQREIIEKAKHNFQELLLEHADLFYHFKSIAPTGTITQDDIKEITDALQDDSRFKNLDRLDQDRKLMLFQHLGFVHCPIREHCPAYPNCEDALIERILGTKAHRPSSWNHNSLFMLNSDNNILNLVILGINGLAEELASEMHSQCEDDEYEIDGNLYSLDYKIIDGDVSLPENSFKTLDFSPNGCFCIYSNTESYEYIRDSLEKTLLSNLEEDDRLPFQGLPLVIIFLVDFELEENEVEHLREEGQNLSESLQCPFIDVSLKDASSVPRFSASLISEALRQLVESIRHRAGFFHAYQSILETSEPDIRIIMCMFCGDPYSVENILGPLLTHQCCFLSGDRSIILETFLGDSKRKVEVIISSFHGANAFREELVHGFILVYSTKRKASLATLNAFSMNIPNLPIQILAVTDTGGATAFFSSDLSHHLITEGNATADRLQAHFMTTVSTCQQKTAFFTPFFKEVWEKKPEIEQAFHMEEPAHVNDSDVCALEDCVGKPIPPPRRESYHLKIECNEGSGSEIYERLPTDTSIGEDGNELLSPEDRILSPSDDSDIYSHVGTFEQDNSESLNKSSDTKSTGKHQSFQVFPQPTTPPEPAPPDHSQSHLVKVSSQSSGSHTSLDEIKSDMNESRESLAIKDPGWVDESVTVYQPRQNNLWSKYKQHSYTTGRHYGPSSKSRPKGNSHTLKQPGKINMQELSHVTKTLSRIHIGSKENVSELKKSNLGHAPLAMPENVDLGSEYAQVKDAVPNIYSSYDGEYAYTLVQDAIGMNVKPKLRHRREKEHHSYSDTDSDWSSLERRHRTANAHSKVNRKSTPHKRIRKKRGIPVPTPRIPLNRPVTLPDVSNTTNFDTQKENIPGSEHFSDKVAPGTLPGTAKEKTAPSAEEDWAVTVNSESLSDASDVTDPEVSNSTVPVRHKHSHKSKHSNRLIKRNFGNGPPPIPTLPDFRNTTQHSRNHGTSIFSSGDIYTTSKPKWEIPYSVIHDEESSLDVSSPRDFNSSMFAPVHKLKDSEKSHRKEKQKNKVDDKQRKRRQKEEKQKKLEKEKEKKKSKHKSKSSAVVNSSSSSAIQLPLLQDFAQSKENLIPLLLEKCVKFIEEEGLDSEGIYRVPGNRAHVDLLFQKFEEDPNVNIHDLDIPVNAVATALKDFFSKRLPPLLTQDMMAELEDISGAGRTNSQLSASYLNLEVITDRSCRLLALRGLLNKLPVVNFQVLKFVFQHFVKISENCKLNNMDSKNLAICWWPTLLPIEFSDMGRFEQMRPYLEDLVQTMIDQYPFLFCGKEAFVMV